MARVLRVLCCLAWLQVPVAAITLWARGTPVAEVVKLLEDIKSKVDAEGKAEATTYDQFACFCKDTTKTKSGSITSGQDNIDSLSADIQKDVADRAAKATDLSERKAKQESLAAELSAEQTRCLKEAADFEATIADLTKAVNSLTSAVGALKSSKPASLLDLRSSVAESLALADALSLRGSRSALTLLQQGVDPASPGYQFHSNEIIETLDGLLSEFTKKKEDTQTEFGKARSACDAFKTGLSDQMSTNKGAMTTLTQDIDGLQKKVSEDRASLVKAEGLLRDDQLYLKDLTGQCEVRAKDWDQRSQMRANEITALAQALAILKDGVDGKKSVKELDEAVNKRALLIQRKWQEAAIVRMPQAAVAVSLFQATSEPRVSPRSDSVVGVHMQKPVDRALASLHQDGIRIQSKMLSSLATQVVSEPFKKVKQLVQQLIERLLNEAAQEATKKGFCDTELGKAAKTRDFRFGDVSQLSVDISSLEAKKDGLEQANKELSDSIATMQKSLNDTTTLRGEEKVQSLDTVKTAREGLAAVTEAIKILKVFYKQADKAGSFAQASPVDQDTTGPGFAGAYSGQQGSSTGVIKLLEVIQTDFARTVRVTEETEKSSQAAFVEFDRTSKVDLKGMETTRTLNQEELETTNNTIEQTTNDLKAAQALLDAALKTMEDLKPMCIDTAMSYADRTAKREEEITALKKALCILDPNKVESECQ